MKIIIGLGNPGSEYAGTRHNAGFEVVDEVAALLGFASRGQFDRTARSKFDGLCVDGLAGSEKVVLLKPMKYMNLSGQSVLAAMQFYQLTPADLLVVVDDIALPCGKLRLRASGSAGGHNGLRDISIRLGTDGYPRLRIGIDLPGRVPQVDYVLQRFSPSQRPLIDDAVARAAHASIVVVERGLTSAMNQFNTDDVAEKKPPRTKETER